MGYALDSFAFSGLAPFCSVISTLPMPDPHHQNDEFGILNFVDEPIVSNPNAVGVFRTDKLLLAGRSRIGRKILSSLDNPWDVARIDSAKILLGTLRKLNHVGVHRQSVFV
jgi:hypothetical protein